MAKKKGKKTAKKGKKGKKAPAIDPEKVARDTRVFLERFRAICEDNPMPKSTRLAIGIPTAILSPEAGASATASVAGAAGASQSNAMTPVSSSGRSAGAATKTTGAASSKRPKSGVKREKDANSGSKKSKSAGGDKDVVKLYDNQVEETVDKCLESAQPVSSLCFDQTCDIRMCRVLCIAFQQTHFPSLKSLCFWGCRVGDFGGKLIAEIMRRLPSLTRLHIVDCGIGRDACAALSVAFQHENKFKRTMRELKLCHNHLGLSGLSILVPPLASSHLRHLSLSYCGLGESSGRELSTIVTKCPLTELNLEGNHLRSAGVLALAAGLPHCQNLAYLNLAMNEFGQTVRRADASASISDDNLLVLVVLAKIFASLVHLQHINLKGNEFGSSGGEIFASALQTCSHIRRLEVTPRMNMEIFKRIHQIVQKRGPKKKARKKKGKKSKKKKK